jgi:hypothetical protein
MNTNTKSITNTKTKKTQKKPSNHVIKPYNNTTKILQTYDNIKKFKTFYKTISKIDKQTIIDYKGTNYISINQYLYNNNKIKELYIEEWPFGNTIKDMFSNNTKELFDYKNIKIENIPKYVELYVNKYIINKINILDKIFTNKEISKLTGNEILYRGTTGNTNTSIKCKIGDTLIFNAFSSTSTNFGTSRQFIGNLFKNKNKNYVHCCLYILYGLKDVPYIYVPSQDIINKNIKSKISKSLYDEFEYLLPRNLKFRIKKIDNMIDTQLSYSNPLKFENLNKIIKHTKHNDIYKKINSKIKVYHIEFIEQLPILPLAEYTYDSKINIHFTKMNDITDIKK